MPVGPDLMGQDPRRDGQAIDGRTAAHGRRRARPERPAHQPSRPVASRRVHRNRDLSNRRAPHARRDQKLPVFSGYGLPGVELATRITHGARVLASRRGALTCGAVGGARPNEQRLSVGHAERGEHDGQSLAGAQQAEERWDRGREYPRRSRRVRRPASPPSSVGPVSCVVSPRSWARPRERAPLDEQTLDSPGRSVHGSPPRTHRSCDQCGPSSGESVTRRLRAGSRRSR